jgi:hypothetical protein
VVTGVPVASTQVNCEVCGAPERAFSRQDVNPAVRGCGMPLPNKRMEQRRRLSKEALCCAPPSLQ